MTISDEPRFLTTADLMEALIPYDDVEVNDLEEAAAVYVARVKLEAKWVAWLADEYAPDYSVEFQKHLYALASIDAPYRSYEFIEEKYVDLARFADEAVKDAQQPRKTPMF